MRVPVAASLAAGTAVLALAALGGAALWALAAGGLLLALTAAGCVALGRREGQPVFAVTVPGPEGLETLPVLSIIEQLPDPIVLLDSSGNVMLSNRAAHTVIQSAAPGRHISAAIRVPPLLDAVRKVLEGSETVAVDYSVMVPIERHLRAHVCPIRVAGTGSERRFALIIIHDMTSIRRLEQTRADFVASASHELRTPLASLSGFIETLRGPARNDETARERFLAIMEEQARRMGRLVNDLLSLSRIELNEHVPPSGTADLAEVIDDVVAALGPIARERGVALDVRGLESAKVTGERDDLVQVFQNLVDNALKYGAEGKRIAIELGQGEKAGPGMPKGPVYWVSVRDFGRGIAREHLPRLTERFYRVDVRQSRDAGGTGLGLAIVKHIVSRHGGWLQIDSRPGEGSTFTVHLPPAGMQGRADTAASDGGDNLPQFSVSRPAAPAEKGGEQPVSTVVGRGGSPRTD
ncbi:MAG: ATP-binding protein [Alphaproteobacteria bacterium]